MAIEDDDIRDREVWTSVSRLWYSKASDKAPTTGRLYHHLAILARPNPLQQLYYYTKSLCVPIPFSSARESIMTLFDPILDPNSAQHSRLSAIDVAFVKAHGHLFSKKCRDDFSSSVDKFCSMLDYHISRTTRKWMESGYAFPPRSNLLSPTKTKIGIISLFQTAVAFCVTVKMAVLF